MAGEFERAGREATAPAGARGMSAQARDTAATAGRDLLDRAVDKKDELKQRAGAAVEEQRQHAAGRVDAISRALHGAAGSLRESGEGQLSEWVEQAAGQVERIVGYMQGKPADGMLHDFEDLARRNPALFLGGTYLAGMAVGRFLRASAPSAPTEGTTGPESRPMEFATDSGITGSATGAPWTGVGVAPSARQRSDTGVTEPGNTDEDTRTARHGREERERAIQDGGYGTGGMSASGSDAIDTGELTGYTHGDEQPDALRDDPRGV